MIIHCPFFTKIYIFSLFNFFATLLEGALFITSYRLLFVYRVQTKGLATQPPSRPCLFCSFLWSQTPIGIHNKFTREGQIFTCSFLFLMWALQKHYRYVRAHQWNSARHSKGQYLPIVTYDSRAEYTHTQSPIRTPIVLVNGPHC